MAAAVAREEEQALVLAPVFEYGLDDRVRGLAERRVDVVLLHDLGARHVVEPGAADDSADEQSSVVVMDAVIDDIPFDVEGASDEV